MRSSTGGTVRAAEGSVNEAGRPAAWSRLRFASPRPVRAGPLTGARGRAQHRRVANHAPDSWRDDAALAAAITQGRGEAWESLLERYGTFVETVAARVVDERRLGPRLEELRGATEAALDALRRNEAAPFRLWSGVGSLRALLAVVARAAVDAHLEQVTPLAPVVTSLPTPAAVYLDEIAAAVPASGVEATLGRLAPAVGAVVRLRLRGMDRNAIGATLGLPPGSVESCLSRLADRLGEMGAGSADPDSVRRIWRVELDAADP
ncbi:MAG: hypothetical protein NZ898_14940, partial [Myxococcota bacterium]|nr:hypothetical protein [Myxococcota bacterium]